MNDLLYTLETLTSDATRECAANTEQAPAVIAERHKAIVRLCDLIKHGAKLSTSDFERVRAIESNGEAIMQGIRKTREDLLDRLNLASRQHSFAKCVEGTLDLPGPIEIPA